MAKKAYDRAYIILSSLGDYQDSVDLLPQLILKWADYVNRGGLSRSDFFNTAVLDDVWDEPLIQCTVKADPFEWLRGSWNSDDGEFLILPQNHLESIQYSFPVKKGAEQYRVHSYRTMSDSSGGTFYLSNGGSGEMDVFHFEPIAPDVVEIYCFANNRTYVMYRYRQ